MNERDDVKSEVGYKALADALRGVVRAQFDLAVILEEEQKDLELASAWFKKAAMQGHIEAAYRAGVICLRDRNSPEEAAYWFTMGASAGHAQSQYYLADLFEHGHGVKLNPETALYWHREAARRGNGASQAKLQSMSNWLGL